MAVVRQILKLVTTAISKGFKTSSKRHQTELSRLVWRLKDEGHIPVIKWSIVCTAKPYSSGAMHCQLCLAEKLAILWADPDTTLNKRSELVAKCRHRNRYKLSKSLPGKTLLYVDLFTTSLVVHAIFVFLRI